MIDRFLRISGALSKILSTSHSKSFHHFQARNVHSIFSRCFHLFTPTRQFSIPSWIPALPQISISCSLEPPSYEKVTSVIRRMKASGSPCPLDQMSIICFKRCPYLRTVIIRLICAIWNQAILESQVS